MRQFASSHRETAEETRLRNELSAVTMSEVREKQWSQVLEENIRVREVRMRSKIIIWQVWLSAKESIQTPASVYIYIYIICMLIYYNKSQVNIFLRLAFNHY